MGNLACGIGYCGLNAEEAPWQFDLTGVSWPFHKDVSTETKTTIILRLNIICSNSKNSILIA